MKNIVGIRFRRLGKIYFFNPKYLILKKDDMVIVDTDEGEEIGKVAIPNRTIDEEKVQKELKKVLSWEMYFLILLLIIKESFYKLLSCFL